jgi:ABC-2 type transport system permease protein
LERCPPGQGLRGLGTWWATDAKHLALDRICSGPARQQALLLSFFGLFPLMFLSGTVAPVESMPEALQRISLASPLRHYLDITLGVFLKGAGIAELWPQALVLVATGLLLFGLAGYIFNRTAR